MQNIYEFTDFEYQITQQLQTIICNEIIQNNGSISFKRFMQLALYHKDFGYYNNQTLKFGNKGDFITAPTVGDLFAKSIANQLNELITLCNLTQILEIGAGNGQLMFDLLAVIGNRIDKYYIFETSDYLIEIQKNKLYDFYPSFKDKVIWLKKLPDEFIGIIIANEVLDAQCCERFKIINHNFYWQDVTFSNDKGFFYVDRQDEFLKDPTYFDVLKKLSRDYESFESELHIDSYEIIKHLAKTLKMGVVLMFDYGYNQTEYYGERNLNGTIRGFLHQHLVDNLLKYPGLIDITTSVNFSRVIDIAIDNNLELIDYVSQANFLLNCGILTFLDIKDQSSFRHLKTTNQINMLLAPEEMGEIFKVIGLSKNIDFIDFIGFKTGSLSYNL